MLFSFLISSRLIFYTHFTEEKSKTDKPGSASGPPGAAGKGRSSAGAGAGECLYIF